MLRLRMLELMNNNREEILDEIYNAPNLKCTPKHFVETSLKPDMFGPAWYDVKFAKELTCAICLNIINDPHMIKNCQHTFCAACLKADKRALCPLCNEPNDAIIPNRMCKNIIDKLDMKCTECNFVGDFSVMTKHCAEKHSKVSCKACHRVFKSKDEFRFHLTQQVPVVSEEKAKAAELQKTTYFDEACITRARKQHAEILQRLSTHLMRVTGNSYLSHGMTHFYDPFRKIPAVTAADIGKLVTWIPPTSQRLGMGNFMNGCDDLVIMKSMQEMIHCVDLHMQMRHEKWHDGKWVLLENTIGIEPDRRAEESEEFRRERAAYWEWVRQDTADTVDDFD